MDVHASDTGPSRTGLWGRRVVMTLLVVVVVLALADRFGQKTSTAAVAAPAATMRVSAPDTVRGGLYFQTRLEIVARRPIETPRLVLDRGFFEGMQVSSIEPAAASESSRNGLVVLSYDPIDAGERIRIWMQFQVDPTSRGTRPYGVELDDGTERLVRVDRDLTVLP